MNTNRLREIAQGLVSYLKCHEEIDNIQFDYDTLTVDEILSNIYINRVHDVFELSQICDQFINLIKEFRNEKEKDVRLIIIDSIAFPFRFFKYDREDETGFKKHAKQKKLLKNISEIVHYVAERFNIAVVITNQMTKKIVAKEYSTTIPALGSSWYKLISKKLNIFRTNEFIYIKNRTDSKIMKIEIRGARLEIISEDNLNERNTDQAKFVVLPTGIRDIPSSRNI